MVTEIKYARCLHYLSRFFGSQQNESCKCKAVGGRPLEINALILVAILFINIVKYYK
jgi:hypothetical protein